MRKFVAAFSAVLLAAFVTLFGVVAPAQAIGNNVTCDAVAGVSTSSYIGAPSLNSSAGYLYPTQNSAYSTGPTFTVAGFTGSPTYTISPSLPAGMVINSSTGAITGTPTVSTSPTLYKVQATGTPSNNNGGAITGQYCAAYEVSIEVWGSGGGGGSPYTLQNFTFGSTSITPNASISNLSAGDAMPGFTTAASGISSGGKWDMINIAIGDLQNGHFYSLTGTSSNTSFNSFGSWNPSTRNCGITSFSVGGVAQSGSSGVTCEKISSVYNGVTQYWISIRITSPSTADFSLSIADGTFTVVSPSNADFINVFATYPDSTSHIQYTCSVSKLLNAVSPGVGSSGADTSIVLPTGIGQPVAGQTVGINASNLALNTNYSVVLRSTPQILDQGTTTATIMNTTVTIPSGLEPGWHSITFTAVRSDGQTVEQVAYFKINASGILLETAETTPAELAYTGRPEVFQWTTGALLALLGVALIAAVVIYRRRVFELVYVLTGNGGQYDIELVEQPKNPRFMPMRDLHK